MKRIITVLFATGLLAALATGCKEEYKTYSDAEYVLFADTLATYAVLQIRCGCIKFDGRICLLGKFRRCFRLLCCCF